MVDKMQFFVLSVYFCLAYVVAALELPPEVTICKKTDSKCMTTAFTKVLQIFASGNKEFGIPKLEPVFVKKIKIPGNGGSINLEQTYTDTYMHGMTKLIANSIKVNSSDSEYIFDVDTQAEKLEMIGTFEAKGNMLLFNVNGGGASNLTMKNMKGRIVLQCEVYDKGGQSHLRVKNLDLYLRDGKLILDYQNLINNNPTLSKAVLDAMNENSDDVFKFLRKDYENMLAGALRGATERIFSEVPLNKLFLD